MAGSAVAPGVAVGGTHALAEVLRAGGSVRFARPSHSAGFLVACCVVLALLAVVAPGGGAPWNALTTGGVLATGALAWITHWLRYGGLVTVDTGAGTVVWQRPFARRPAHTWQLDELTAATPRRLIHVDRLSLAFGGAHLEVVVGDRSAPALAAVLAPGAPPAASAPSIDAGV